MITRFLEIVRGQVTFSTNLVMDQSVIKAKCTLMSTKPTRTLCNSDKRLQLQILIFTLNCLFLVNQRSKKENFEVLNDRKKETLPKIWLQGENLQKEFGEVG